MDAAHPLCRGGIGVEREQGLIPADDRRRERPASAGDGHGVGARLAVVGEDGVEPENGAHFGRGGGAEPRGEGVVGEQLLQRGGEVVGLGGSDETGVLVGDAVAEAGRAGHGHGAGHRHGFKNGLWVALILGALGVDSALPHESKQLGMRDARAELGADVEPRGEVGQGGGLGSLADDEQASARAELGGQATDRLDEQVDALLAGEAPGGEDEAGLAPAQRSRRLIGEDEVGHKPQSVARDGVLEGEVVENAGRGGDDDIGGAEKLAFEEAGLGELPGIGAVFAEHGPRPVVSAAGDESGAAAIVAEGAGDADGDIAAPELVGEDLGGAVGLAQAADALGNLGEEDAGLEVAVVADAPDAAEHLGHERCGDGVVCGIAVGDVDDPVERGPEAAVEATLAVEQTEALTDAQRRVGAGDDNEGAGDAVSWGLIVNGGQVREFRPGAGRGASFCRGKGGGGARGGGVSIVEARDRAAGARGVAGERCVVTFVVPMFQAERTVGQTVRSILDDLDVSAVAGEVIVVDDGSRDSGPAVVEQIAERDGRVRVIRRSNRGPSAARNTGIDVSRGEWLRFVDADDEVVAGSTRRLLAAAERAGAGGACGAYELMDERGRLLGRRCPCAAGTDGMVGVAQLLDGNAMGTGALALRRSALGPRRFDEAMRSCEDWDLWLRLAGGSDGVGAGGVRWAGLAAADEPVKRYRVSPAGLSRNFGAMLRAARGVADRGHARAGSAGGSGHRQTLARQAVAYATMQVLAPEDGALDRAAAMVKPDEARMWTAADLGSAAAWAVLVGLGMRPEVVAGAAWVGRIEAWWDVLETRGLVASEHSQGAWRVFAAEALPPSAIAVECVRRVRADGAARAVIVGMGQNGQLVAAAAAGLGLAVEARDDRQGVGRMVDEPIDRDAWVVVSPTDDRRLVERLAGRIRPERTIRWSEVRGELTAQMLRTLDDARAAATGVA